MSQLFYVSGLFAIIAAIMVVTHTNAMHALLYLVLLFLSIASVFWTLGAPFAAVLEIVIYAGAIMVLFVFVVMMLNLGAEAQQRERTWTAGLIWALPLLLAAGLLAQFLVTLISRPTEYVSGVVQPAPVGVSLYTTYLIGVEVASLLLLAGLVAAFHFGAFIRRPGGK